jgi:pyruvate/2-oxoglutarate dehydrogenase complex dihydrolipoamide dehydrogenase (E3) component
VSAGRVDLLVVGAGPAGLAAAAAATGRGARVAVADAAFPGGHAVAHSLLPSKVHLAAAQDLAAPGAWGEGGSAAAGLRAALATLRWRREAARDRAAARLAAAGARFLPGRLTFEAPGQARLAGPGGEETVRFAAAVVAVGSVGRVPEGVVADGRQVLLPRDLASLAAVPARSIVLGGGATGLEVATLLMDYGSEVTVVSRSAPLPGEERVLAAELVRRLTARGMTWRCGEAAGVTAAGAPRLELRDGRRLESDAIFLCGGRRGAAESLAAERLGAAVDGDGFVRVDSWLLAAPGVHAAGDVVGPPLTASKAQAEGHAAALLALGETAAVPDRHTLPTAVFSRPEYARVGRLPRDGEAVRVLDSGDAQTWRRAVLGDAAGFGRLRVWTRPDGAVMGAALLGEGAADAVQVWALAARRGLAVSEVAMLSPVTPSLSELASSLEGAEEA